MDPTVFFLAKKRAIKGVLIVFLFPAKLFIHGVFYCERDVKRCTRRGFKAYNS